MKGVLTILTIFVSLISIKAQEMEISETDFMDAFIVVSDTSKDYSMLSEKMGLLSEKTNFEIDMMGRGFDKTKNLICLPADDEDEIYAGDYFPRRSPSETLSLEYLDYYSNEEESTGNIALVVMITDELKKAERKLKQIRKHSENAFIVKTKLYMGCMH